MASKPPPPRFFGLEVRREWADALITGHKTVEVRNYDLPAEFVGARVHLLATSGPPGVAALADAVAPGDAAAVVVGWVVFGPAEKYETADAFAADAHRHRVPPDSVYAWQEDRDTYGWPVIQVGAVDEPRPPTAQGTRVLRSLYTFDRDPV